MTWNKFKSKYKTYIDHFKCRSLQRKREYPELVIKICLGNDDIITSYIF